MRRLGTVLGMLLASAVVGGCAAIADLTDGAVDVPPPRRVASAPAPAPPPPTARPETAGPRAATTPTDAVPDEDRRIFEEANRLRRAAGLAPFRWNEALQRAARDHSEEQRRHGYMGHGSPDPRRDALEDRLRAAGYGPARQWGEVVAMGYDGPRSVMAAWMDSRGHRRILMDPGLEEAAFSRAGAYFTGDFASPR